MQFNRSSAEIFIPDGSDSKEALSRTTHMAFSAHQDDIEIMAIEGVLQCFQKNDQWFTGVVVTDGRGSPRAGDYQNYTDDDMRLVRFAEQKKAAFVGEYAAQVLLDHPSKVVKNQADPAPTEDIVQLLKIARPRVVYTHNLADKHDTHVATALRVIAAIRQLPPAERPQRVTGCEVWRNLDWVQDDEKVIMDTSAHENLQNALIGVFDSQIVGGKSYDQATMGRRKANATYLASHATDALTSAILGMDLTPLIQDTDLDITTYILGYIQRFASDVQTRLQQFTGK